MDKSWSNKINYITEIPESYGLTSAFLCCRPHQVPWREGVSKNISNLAGQTVGHQGSTLKFVDLCTNGPAGNQVTRGLITLENHNRILARIMTILVDMHKQQIIMLVSFTLGSDFSNILAPNQPFTREYSKINDFTSQSSSFPLYKM